MLNGVNTNVHIFKMDLTRFSLFFILLYVRINAARLYHNTKIHKDVRFNLAHNDIRFQKDNTIRQNTGSPTDTVTHREDTAASGDTPEPNDGSQHMIPSWQGKPPESVVEPVGINPSTKHDGPTRDVTILKEIYSDGLKVSEPARIQNVETDECVCNIKQSQQGEITANCSRRGLESVPTDLPSYINVLDLSHNLLSYLANNTFTIFSNLTLLNLNFNKISRVDIQSFAGLFKLTTLFMTGNILTSNKTSVPPELFSDLNNLETLVIERNNFEVYPDWIFTQLTQLKNLAISSDERSPIFGLGFHRLKNLKFLQMDSQYFEGGDCYIEELDRETFSYLQNSPIGHLVINSCSGLRNSSNYVFEPLSSLAVLELSHNKLDIQKALHMLRPFDGRNMTSIRMDSVDSGYTRLASYYKSLVVTNKTLQYLGRICVSEVSLKQNGIVWLANIWAGTIFSKCIRKFDLSGNELRGDGYVLLFLSAFKSLVDVRISMKKSLLGTFNYANHDLILKSFNMSLKREISLLCPPKLEYLDMSGHLADNLDPFIFTMKNCEHLKTVNFGYNNFKNIIEFRGFENVTTVDLSGQTFAYKKGAVGSFPSAEHMTLTFNNFKFIDPSESKQVFENLRRLSYIDLSHNQLRFIPQLPNPSLLRTIILAHNELNTVPMLDEFTGLKYLDLSNNLIGLVDEEIREFLDQAHEEHNWTISVTGNPFLCDCTHFDFIVWLVETKVIHETNRNFPCMRVNGTMTNTKEVAARYYIENRRCNGKLHLAFTVILLIVLIMAIVITYFVGRNPIRARNLILKVFGFGVRYLSPSDFEFTLYVGYCQEDVPFVVRNLRLELERGRTRVFLHDRDVLPGVPIANGIIEGVTRSWKVLLVISQDFLDDPWSDFVISTAVYAMTDLIPDRILVLLMGGVQVEELPEILLRAVDEELILCVDQFKGDQLWIRLKELAHIE